MQPQRGDQITVPHAGCDRENVNKSTQLKDYRHTGERLLLLRAATKPDHPICAVPPTIIRREIAVHFCKQGTVTYEEYPERIKKHLDRFFEMDYIKPKPFLKPYNPRPD